ncbi:MAG: hypothetical protein HKN64_08020 [Woeseiaceae bacterium]|nr:hypothetical protein [Woeseiaceae bacterium]
MTISKKTNCIVAATVAAVLLAACAARPELIARSSTVPAGIDFSGDWQLLVTPGAKSRPPAPVEQGIRIPREGSPRNPGERQQRQQPRSSGSAINLFFETGESLKVTQTASGLFISFDRAIVEEYAFGEKRIVTVGPIEAQRVSGWENDTFVVETLDAEGSLLAESWRLEDEGTKLTRDVVVTRGDTQKWFLRQRFVRD